MSPTAPPPVRQRPVPSRTPQRPNRRPASQRAHSRWGRESAGVRAYRLRSTGRRLRIAAAAMAVFFLLLAGRLVQLQGFQSHTYATIAEDQRRHTIDQPATRGEITDRSGNVLAVDVDANDVYANPHKVTDVLGEAAKLAPYCTSRSPRSSPSLLPNANFRYLALDVDTTVGEQGHQAQPAGHRHPAAAQAALPGRQSGGQRPRRRRA